jgi:hypothetical protein
VCHTCHGTVVGSGNLLVSSTGEFRVEQIMAAAADQAAVAVGPGDAPSVRCTWCGKGEGEVRKILSGGSAHICDGCVALCSDVLYSELGEDWNR